ncbi:uroporphyrinogen-III C-methyltransferase [Nitratireductor soli]|uniref:uroporphyrinogen-III C-methyltransferase n=1 Tax=Nitratireductor soli TaxID=1670619 RepID=UPI00065DC298|nr:uroporphyrinogen-III C-methyltransferase [Nitratireductor soli]
MNTVDALTRLGFEPAKFEPGHVWLAGAGPGGLACLTLGVLAALSEADSVVYDALVDPAVLKAAPQATHHYVGKRAGQPSTSQDDINRLLVDEAKAGRRVLRLKGGDPNMFGRGGEEAFVLARAGIPFRFLPGITSAVGALADAGIPATMRGVNKAIVFATGHAAGTPDDLDWAALARTGQPIVVYMGMHKLPLIVDALTGGGLAAETPAALIMDATTPRERILVADLGSLVAEAERQGFGSPAIIVIGGIVALREQLR